MAEWRTATHTTQLTTSTFSVIGYPFTFIWSSVVGAEEKSLRCYPDITDAEQQQLRYELRMDPRREAPPHYDLVFKKVNEAEEIFEEGWYLSGIGHHLEWCDVNLESAVDEAQEMIAWDGQDPTAPGLPPIVRDAAGFLSHKLPYSDFGMEEDDPLTELYERWRFPYAKKPTSA